MPYKLALPVALLFTFAACSSSPPDSDEEEIVGSWWWLRSSGGFGGGTISPETEGYSERLIRYHPDGSFKAYHADTLFQSGRYFLERDEGDTIISYVTEEDQVVPQQRVEFAEGSKLILTDLCFDCYVSTYRRSE